MSDKLDKFHIFNIGECHYCHKSYSNPHILNCLHTFCLDCIKQMSNGIDPKCSICKEKFELQSTGLPAHYSNRSFEDLSKVKQLMGKINVNQNCELCKKHPATEYCRECKTIICEHDAKIHRKSTKDEHQLFNLNVFHDYNNIFQLIPENTMNYCKQHQEKLIQFYCYRCNVVLCTECAHGGHMEDPCYANEMNSMFHGRREMMTQRQTEQGVKVTDISIQQHRNQIEEIAKEEENLLNKINNEFDAYINCLNQRRNELNNTVRTVFAQRRKEIENVISSHEEFIKDSNQVLDMASFYLNDLPGTHLFPPAVALCNKMDRLERTRPAITADMNQLDFTFSRDSHFVHDPQRIGKLSVRFPFGFESFRHEVELNMKMKLPFEFKIKGMTQTCNGNMQILLQDTNEKKKNQKHILRLNQCFQPVHANKWLENITTTLEEHTSISHFNATRDGTTLIVDRGNKQFRSISNGRVISSLSESNSGSCLHDPFNVIGRNNEGFAIFNKHSNTVELYNNDSKLEIQFEVSQSQKQLLAPSTPTSRVPQSSATPDPSLGSGGFISFPLKCKTPEKNSNPQQPSQNLLIGCNSFGEIYYASDTKPIIKRFNQKGEKLGEKTYAEHANGSANRVASSSKPNTNTLKLPLERSGTLRKGTRPPSSASRPITLTIPIPHQNPAPKVKEIRTLIAIDPFNNVYVYQNGFLYVLDMSLDNVQAKGKIKFEPDYMMVTEMGQIILATSEDSLIRVY